MSYYFHKTPKWIQIVYPELTWRTNSNSKEIYLTFDDGPIPEVTPFVLDQLSRYEAKASFFCVGENIEKNPKEFNQVIEQGHTVGNHTFNHVIGWGTDDEHYSENIEKCQFEIEKHTGKRNKKLFRPPHGRIKRSQIKRMKQEYEIIMWTYLTGDFDSKLNSEICLSKAKERIGKGDLVIFHDSLKAYKNLEYTLPRFLKHFSERGFQFKSVE
ncbi:MAG: peptidoglycan/xylan/chitin deacetylase (PgdA/CDA1 family) [Cyclobacteriaceae bacterium]